MPFLRLCLKHIKGIEDAFYGALASNNNGLNRITEIEFWRL